jgi:hypothetical protein
MLDPQRLTTVSASMACYRDSFTFFTKSSKPALGPTQPPTKWVPGDLSPEYSGRGVKLTTQVKNSTAIPPLTPVSSSHSTYLITHMDNIRLESLRSINICYISVRTGGKLADIQTWYLLIPVTATLNCSVLGMSLVSLLDRANIHTGIYRRFLLTILVNAWTVL